MAAWSPKTALKRLIFEGTGIGAPAASPPHVLPACIVASFVSGLAARALGWLALDERWSIGAGLVFCVLAVATRGRPLYWFLALIGGALAWGAVLAPTERDPVAFAELSGGLAELTFDVERSGCAQRGCWSEARLVGCRALEPRACVAAGARLGIGSMEELPLGARVHALGSLALRAEFRNPLPTTTWPDVRPTLQARLRDGARPKVESSSLLDAQLARARVAIRAAFRRSLVEPHAGIARALLLGEGSAVDGTLNDAIRNAGVSHVLAVSGMHVTLLVGALVGALRRLWLFTPLALRWEARRVAAGVGVLLAPLVARLCGSSPSAVRAAWTSALMYLIVAAGLRPCALSVSALVVGVHATLVPHDALHPGFVLSVLATAALLTERRGAGGVIGALRESMRAWLATAPFLLLCFGQTSLIAVLANVALLPVGEVLVPLAAVHAALALARFDGELPSAALLELASGAFVEAARYCAALDPGFVLPPLTALEVLAAALLALACMLPLARRTRALTACVAVGVALPSEWALRRASVNETLRVTFLDVGQGDSTLLETGGHALLIDAGGNVNGGPDPGARAVLPLLRARRIARLDAIVLSHPHPDHYGGMRALLAALPVGELWDTGQAAAEGGGAVASLIERARELGVRVRRPDELCREPQRLGDVQLRVLAPCPAFDDALGANDNSFVVRATHQRRSFLFTGDIEQAAEAQLVKRGRALQSDVLKVAHHGSHTSSTAELLAAVRPWLAVASAGRANRFGHPHADVVERLRAVTQLLRTDRHGGIDVVSDGMTLTVSAWDPSVSLRYPAAP